MTVKVGAESHFGVVGVDDGDVLEADRLFRVSDEAGEAGFVCNVETGDVAVAGVETEADGEIKIGFDELADCGDFFEFASELCTGSGGVFEEQIEARIFEKFGVDVSDGQDDGFGDIEDALFNGESFVVAGMGD